MTNNKQIKKPALREQDLQRNHLEGLRFERMMDQRNSAFYWFVQVNSIIPSRICFGHGEFPTLLKDILRTYDIRSNNIALHKEYAAAKKKYVAKFWTVFLKRDLALTLEEENGLTLFYGYQNSEHYIKQWITFIKHLAKLDESDDVSEDVKPGQKTLIYLLEMQMFSGPKLKPFEIPKPSLDIDLHYNDDFKPVHETILGRLKTKGDSGLVLLHGKPGTGKTTYIRNLCFLLNKKVIYIPPQVAGDLASVDFVTFMLRHPNSVIIIEDAESIITGKDNRTDTIAGLLNITDGLLGDCLNIQIICTFNTDIRMIDKALLRQGRLIALYGFMELTIDKSNCLLKHLKSDEVTSTQMTLADIYNIDQPEFSYYEKGTVGFK